MKDLITKYQFKTNEAGLTVRLITTEIHRMQQGHKSTYESTYESIGEAQNMRQLHAAKIVCYSEIVSDLKAL